MFPITGAWCAARRTNRVNVINGGMRRPNIELSPVLHTSCLLKILIYLINMQHLCGKYVVSLQADAAAAERLEEREQGCNVRLLVQGV